MRTATEVLPAQLTVREAFERISSSEFRAWPVTDRLGVVGVVSLSTLQRKLAEGTAKPIAELVDALSFPHVHKDQTLDLALDRMGAARLEVLPVVNRADTLKLEGVITLDDVLNTYGVELHRRTSDACRRVSRITETRDARPKDYQATSGDSATRDYGWGRERDHERNH